MNINSGSIDYNNSNIYTSGPGNYKLNESRLRNKINYPFAPTMIIQNMGGSVMDQNFIDVDSEIKNITRPLSNNPQKKYIPGNENEEKPMIHFEDGGFHQVSSRLTNNAFELKGVGINRWEPLFFDPQKNAIEPFRRIGDNTVLHTLDQHVEECGNK
tara:strand:- start:735 stop:1205 length:471 start_codon:yes stop_codon:yes gene_type:complete